LHPYPGGGNFEDVYFASQDSGWIVGSHGCILFTSDRGTTWDFQTGNTDQTLNSIYYTNTSVGWIVGDNGTILHTNDAGSLWESQNSPVQENLRSVFFLDNQGWIAGNNGTILHTSDGKTWELQTTGTEKTLTAVHFVNDNEGWAAGYEGAIIHTSDGGNSWEDQGFDNPYQFFYNIHFFDTMNGKATEDGAVFETQDGGKTWTEIFSAPLSLINSFHLGVNETWLLGQSDIDWFYYALYTDDNFQSYEIMEGYQDWINSIFFTDHDHGWIVGHKALISHTSNVGEDWLLKGENLFSTFKDICASGLYNAWVVGEGGVISHTNNSGWEWTFQNSGTFNDLHSVYFADDETGWTAGDEGTMLNTVDGGASWQDQVTGTTEVIKDVMYIDQANGWCVGSNGLILHSNNGGESWEQQNSNTNEDLRSICFKDQLTGWAAGGSTGIILNTSDGGQSWAQQYEVGEALLKICFINQDQGWACGTNILKTMDGGNSWTTLPTIDPYEVFTDLCFVDQINGWVIAVYTHDDPISGDPVTYYDIHFTDDGGETWTKQHVNGEKRSLFFVDRDNGWAAGNDVVFKTTNGGGAFDIEERLTDDLISIKPNPCSGTAFLRYQISDIRYMICDLYSISGKRIKRLLNEEKMPGEYEMEVDMSKLPSGIYFVVLKTDDVIFTEKVVKL